jgi:predicted XRE-type DNA-binding protein
LWIHELSQYEAANVLGITRDKVKDLWRRIRLHIATNCSELAAHIGR